MAGSVRRVVDVRYGAVEHLDEDMVQVRGDGDTSKAILDSHDLQLLFNSDNTVSRSFKRICRAH